MDLNEEREMAVISVPGTEVSSISGPQVSRPASQTRDKGLVDICRWALDCAENPDSEATAGIEPAMKVLQTSR